MRAKSIAKETIQSTTTTRVRELTPREVEVIRLIWEEYSTKEIGVRLGISPRTVEAHRWNIFKKTGAKSTVGIIKFALRAGIIEP